MIKVFLNTFKSPTKSIDYIQTRLRSAKDIFSQGGHVTMVYKDQKFRMHFDNKRVLEVPLINISTDGLLSEVILDSLPLNTITHGENLRFISKLNKLKQYSRFSSPLGANRYKKHEDLAITNFLKALISEPPLFNLHREGLNDYKAIIEYIQGFDSTIKLTIHRIAYLKRTRVSWKSVPRLPNCVAFITYIKQKFKDFDEDSFFRKID